MEAKAVARTVRIAPRKARLVVDLIRGKQVGEAISILKFTPKAASPIVEKVLNSAIANAEHNYEMDVNNLVVSKAYVDEGPTLKRFRPRAQGRASKLINVLAILQLCYQKKGGIMSGSKVNPIGLRVGIIRDWESKWYADKDYAELLHEDIKIREYIYNRLKDAAVSGVEIERAANRVNITIHTAKPGMVIGKGGSEVEALRKALNAITGKRCILTLLKLKRQILMQNWLLKILHVN